MIIHPTVNQYNQEEWTIDEAFALASINVDMLEHDYRCYPVDADECNVYSE